MSTGVASIEGHTALLRATDHLENCIDAVRRAEGYFDSRAFKDIVSEDHRAILQTLHQGLHSIRNSIQHAQDRFDQGRIPEGDPLFPAMTTDFIYFAGEIVTYAEIAALVIVVWQLASAGVLAVTSR